MRRYADCENKQLKPILGFKFSKAVLKVSAAYHEISQTTAHKVFLDKRVS